MRKTYPLTLDGKNRDRLLDASKHDIRKYFRRERGKPLPAGADVWQFDTRVGLDEASATQVRESELIATINTLTAGGAAQFFVEIVARPGKRTRPDAEAAAAPSDELDFEQD